MLYQFRKKNQYVRDVNRHFRPISLSTIVPKVVEGFVVDNFIKQALLKKVDPSRVFYFIKVMKHAKNDFVFECKIERTEVRELIKAAFESICT